MKQPNSFDSIYAPTDDFVEIFGRTNENSRITLDKVEETLRVSEEIMQNLTPEAVNELLGGNDNDIDEIFKKIVRETYDTLFGTRREVRTSAFGYLDKLTSSIEETLRIESLPYFVMSVLDDFSINWHHLDWFNLMETVKYLTVIAARGHGKSFAFTYAYPLWKMYGYKSQNLKYETRNIMRRKGYIFSFSIQQAIDLLKIIKDGIQSNAILKERLYPSDSNSKWAQMEIECKNGTYLRVKGFGSSVRGAHPNYIIVDDGLKDNVMYSSVQRKKSIDYFHSVIMNAIEPGGQVMVVGTPFHAADLYGDLKEKKAGWVVREYPGIFPDGTLLWPDRFTYEQLMEKRATQGNLVFSREILCRPITSESSIFPIEIMNRAFLNMEKYQLVDNIDSFPIKFKSVVVGCDFAISASVGADYSVFGVWGIDELDHMWLIHLYREKGRSYAEQLAMLKYINQAFRPAMFLMEVNTFQMIFKEGAEQSGLPVFPHVTSQQKNDLKSGLPSIAIRFERGSIHIPTGDQRSRDVADLFITEFTSIAFTEKGIQSTLEHDDICMQTYMAVEAVKKLTSTPFSFSFISA